MAFLGRKFTSSKWTELEDSVCADGVTYCLRTSGNTLSFWVANDLDEKAVKDIVLAFVANGDKIEKQEIVLINESFFKENGLEILDTDGNTKVDDLIKSHKDIISLNLRKLEIISNEILAQVKALSQVPDEHLNEFLTIRMFDKNEVKEILLEAIKENRLKENLLTEKLRAKLQA